MRTSFYFPHDFHARHDPKLERLFWLMGYEGLGIYWCLIEMLYEQGGKILLSDISLYAKADEILCQRIKELVKNFSLFETNETHFWSLSVLKRLQHMDEKSKNASNSALKRWDNANAMPTQCEGSASKTKENKRKQKNTGTPTLSNEVFLQTLKDNQAYKHIDIEQELGKMDGWLLLHPNRKKTRPFILRWLNRVEKPLPTLEQPKRRMLT